MPPRRQPTLRARLLGQHLRQLREHAHLTLRDVAKHIQRDASTVSRLESGTLPPRMPEVLAYLDLCGIDDLQQRDDLEVLSHDVHQTGWWDDYADELTPAQLDQIWLESRAHHLRLFQSTVVPELLQISQYSAAIARGTNPDLADHDIQRRLHVLGSRQRVLERNHPPRLTAILDEAILYRPIGGSPTITTQLQHLAHCARQSTVELHIPPINIESHPYPHGTLEIAQLPAPYPTHALIPAPAGPIHLDEATSARIADTHTRLQGQALTTHDSLELVETLIAR